MKKLFHLMMMAVCCSMLLTACGSEDEDPNTESFPTVSSGNGNIGPAANDSISELIAGKWELETGYFPFSLQHSFGKGEVILDFQNEGNLTISGTTQQYCSWPKGGYQYSTGYQNGKALILSISSEEYSDEFFLRINGNILDIQEISESEYCIFRFHRLN